MGSSDKPKQPVADYRMSLHLGVAHTVDSVDRIQVHEKEIWKGKQTTNDILSIHKPKLFGGNKKEGGVRGLVHVLLGGPAQVLDSLLAEKLGGMPATVPGFRGVTSLFFTGGGTQSSPGFYWSSNLPYMRSVDVTVTRAPKGFYPEKALIPRVAPRAAGLVLKSTDQTAFTYGNNSLFGPKPYYIGPYTVSFYVPQWNNTYPPTSSFTKVTFNGVGLPSVDVGGVELDLSSISTESIPVTVESGDVPPQGSTDDSREYWKTQETVWGSTIPWNMLGAGDNMSHRNGRYVAVIPGRDLVFTRGGISAGVLSIEHTTAIAITTDGSKIYVCSLDRIDVYDSDFDLLQTQAGSFSVGITAPRVVLDGDFLYFGNAIGGPLYVIHAVTLATVSTLTLPVVTIMHFNAEFRVYGNRLVRAYVQSGPNRLVVETYQIDLGDSGASDANPAHIIYECLTDTDWGLGLPVSQIDTAAFTVAADTLYAEGFGLSMMWSTQTTIETFINDVLAHIDGTYGIDPATGKIYLKLVRDDYDIEDLFELNDDNCRITRFQRKALGETTNEVVVTWTNPENEKEETVTVHDIANYAVQGQLVSASSNYYGVRTSSLALRLAMRDLGKASNPVASFEVLVDRSGWNKKSGDVISIRSADYGINGLPVRVMSVNYGRPGDSKVQMTLLEDVFQMPAGAYVDAPSSEWSDSSEPPASLVFSQVASPPYYFVAQEQGSLDAAAIPNPETYSMILGVQPGTDTRSFEVHDREVDALGNISFDYIATLPLSGRALLTAPLVVEATTADVQMGSFLGALGPVAGVFMWIGEGNPQTSELVLISSTLGSINVMRGVLDTCIRPWPAGTPVWFLATDVDISEPTTRLGGQTVTYKLLPTTSQGTLELSWAPVTTGALDNRMHLPYRPANVQINGLFWPSMILTMLTITWSRRNRLLEDPVVRAWTDADVTPEPGQTTTARLYRADNGALVTQTTGITGTSTTLVPTYSGQFILELTAVRDGLESYQPFRHQFEFINGDLRLTEEGADRITEAGEPRTTE